MKRALPVLSLLIVLLALAGLVVALYHRARDLLAEFDEQVQQLEAVSAAGQTLLVQQGPEAAEAARRLPGVSLPDDAENAYFARQGTLAPFYWLRFDLPPDSLPTLLDGACFQSGLEPGYNPDFAYGASPDVIANLDWWQPETASSAVGARCSLRPGVTMTLLVDQTDPARWRVYLEIITSR